MSILYNQIQRRQAPAKLHTKRSIVDFWRLTCLSSYLFQWRQQTPFMNAGWKKKAGSTPRPRSGPR